MTFARTFPAYHPKRGDKTYFIEAILTERGIDYTNFIYFHELVKMNPQISRKFLNDFWLSLNFTFIPPKSHTIRSHKRQLKVGDFINHHCWAGKPYKLTHEGFWKIKFAPNMEVKKVWNIEIFENHEINIAGKFYASFGSENCHTLAKNDGLENESLRDWFLPSLPFKGEIYCWNENINY